MSEETVRAIVNYGEYGSDWSYEIYVPDPQYAADVFKNYYDRDRVYDLPKELVEKYEAARAALNEVDEQLVEIVRERRGKVERKFPGLPPV